MLLCYIYIFINTLRKKRYKQLIMYPLIFLGSMLTPIIPWLCYFTLNNAIDDFFFVYLLINLSSYSNVNISIFKAFFNCSYFFLRNLKVSGLSVFIIFDCLIFPLFSKKFKLYDKFTIISALFFEILFIYVGGVYYIYYILPILIFTLFSLIYIYML